MRPKIYVAGPYTIGDVAKNVRNAVKMGDDLADYGFTPFIPHLSHLHHTICPRSYDFWTDWCNQFLPVCEILIRLPGESKGSDAEVLLALSLGIPVVFTIDEAVKWIHEHEKSDSQKTSGDDILLDAHSLIHGERQEDYAHPGINFQRAAKGFTWWLEEKLKPGCVVDEMDIPQLMSIWKKARLKNGYKRDSVVDDAGYVGTIGMVHDWLEQQKKRDDEPPTFIDSGKYGE